MNDIIKIKSLGYRMAMLLDIIMPVLATETKREAAREAGKPMRCITMKTRQEHARKLLEEAKEVFEYDP